MRTQSHCRAGSLKWETIDGCKFDVTKPFNPNFFFSHRCGPSSRKSPRGR